MIESMPCRKKPSSGSSDVGRSIPSTVSDHGRNHIAQDFALFGWRCCGDPPMRRAPGRVIGWRLRFRNVDAIEQGSMAPAVVDRFESGPVDRCDDAFRHAGDHQRFEDGEGVAGCHRCQSEPIEEGFGFGGSHAATRDTSPGDRQAGQTLRAAASSQRIEKGVGGRIVGLAGCAPDARRRREQHEVVERHVARERLEHERPPHFRLEHRIEGGTVEMLERRECGRAGEMKDPSNGKRTTFQRSEQARHGVFVGDVRDDWFDWCANLFELEQGGDSRVRPVFGPG